MARLDARWNNFSERGQTWDHFWQDTKETGSTVGDIVEALSATDASTSTLTVQAAVSESASAIDIEGANLLLLAAITESAAASDVQSALTTLLAAITEGASASDVASALQQTIGAIVESANPSDTLTSTKQVLADLTETISASESSSASKTTIAGVLEVLTAVETSNFIVAGGNTFPSNRLINDMRILNQWIPATVMVFMSDATNHIDGKTGLTLSILSSKNGSAFSAISPQVTEIGYGWYRIKLLRQHTDVLGDLVLHVTGTGADPSCIISSVIVPNRL